MLALLNFLYKKLSNVATIIKGSFITIVNIIAVPLTLLEYSVLGDESYLISNPITFRLAFWSGFLNPKKKDSYRYTPLMTAASIGATEAANFLLARRDDEIEFHKLNSLSALIEAVKNKHAKVVKILLENNMHTSNNHENNGLALVAPNHMDIDNNYGNKALCIAAKNGDTGIIKLLLDGGADINHPEADYNAYTPLMTAAAAGELATVKFLIENGAKVDILNSPGNTALMVAIKAGKLHIVKFLIENSAIQNHISNNFGYTPFTLAASSGHIEIVEYLLNKGIKVNHKDVNDNTTLMAAAEAGKLATVKFLIERGADVYMRNKYGYHAITLAASSGHIEIVAYFLSETIDINQKDANDNTALMAAAEAGKLATVKFLIERGADAYMINIHGYTALTLAASRGHIEIVEYLLNKAIDINRKDGNDKTALMAAAEARKLAMVKFLMEHGAKDKDGLSGLKYAVTKAEQVAEFMIANKPSILYEIDANGDNELTRATKEKDSRLIKFLIKHNVDVNKPNAEGQTTLMIATSNEDRNTIKLLLNRDANIDIKNPQGQTAINIAAARDESETLKIILAHYKDSLADSNNLLNAQTWIAAINIYLESNAKAPLLLAYNNYLESLEIPSALITVNMAQANSDSNPDSTQIVIAADNSDSADSPTIKFVGYLGGGSLGIGSSTFCGLAYDYRVGEIKDAKYYTEHFIKHEFLFVASSLTIAYIVSNFPFLAIYNLPWIISTINIVYAARECYVNSGEIKNFPKLFSNALIVAAPHKFVADNPAIVGFTTTVFNDGNCAKLISHTYESAQTLVLTLLGSEFDYHNTSKAGLEL